MKCSLGISNFLEEISSLSHTIVFPLIVRGVAQKPFCGDIEILPFLLTLPYKLSQVPGTSVPNLHLPEVSP